MFNFPFFLLFGVIFCHKIDACDMFLNVVFSVCSGDDAEGCEEVFGNGGFLL